MCALAEPSQTTGSLAEQLEVSTAREAELRNLLVTAHEQLLQLDRELEQITAELTTLRSSRVWRYGSRLAGVKRAISRSR